ncbi:uncharacterized protein LOC130748133 [Lotus japonicus]|uniref:uncharacterized protein LOC130748133 n=1 Tax=Lotus japonicus TaxID=34305 RepID=UPI002586CB8E|nr:uncharacterized protein LOC130748133 [Lotus japonicus]
MDIDYGDRSLPESLCDHGQAKPPDNGEGVRGPSFWDTLMGGAQTAASREVEDYMKTGKMKVEYAQGNKRLPKVFLDKSVTDNMYSPWKESLVVSLLGKTLGFRTMRTKLSNIWRLAGEFDLLDVDNGFYLVKFDLEEDKQKVMEGGPWMIFDHYLAVSTWSRDFVSPAAKVTKTLAWVRIPGLNVVYYDESFLLSIANVIGTPVKVDTNTLKAERGRFARICVEIDLTEPVVGKL